MRSKSIHRLIDFAGHTTAAFFFALLVTMLIFWSRSLRGTDALEIPGPGDKVMDITSTRGKFMFGIFQDADAPRTYWTPRHVGMPDLVLGEDFNWIADFWGWGFAVPHLLIAAIAIVPCLWWAIVFRERQKLSERVSSGLCMECGYDLRYSSGRCPECGTRCGIAALRSATPRTG